MKYLKGRQRQASMLFALIVCFIFIIGCGQVGSKTTTSSSSKINNVVTKEHGAINLEDLNYRSKPVAASTPVSSAQEAVQFIPKLQPLFTGTSRVGMRLLIISANGNAAIRDGTDPMLDSATYFAEQIGIPFDVLIATNEQLTEARLLAANGDGRYQGIVLTNSSLTFNNAGVFESAFDQAEWNLLWQYAREFNVRQLSLDSFPGAFPEDLGLREGSSVTTTATTPLDVNITSAGQSIFSSLKADASIPIKNAFVNLASICTEDATVVCPTGVTTTPILRSNTSNQIVATVSKTADNREILNLTMAHNYFLTHTALLSYDLFKWVTQGVFIGAREMYLQLDIDDWYQASLVWDPATNANGFNADGSQSTFKLAGNDVFEARAQLADLKSRFSVAPNLNFTNAIVGFKGDGTASLSCTAGASLSSATLCVKDEFDWVSHTYTERIMNFESPGYNNAADEFYTTEDPELNSNLNGFTCNDTSITGFSPTTIAQEIVLKELICNSQKLSQLGIPFNPNSIITSAHSGLGHYNPDPLNPNFIDNGLQSSSPGTLQAMTDVGIKYMASNWSVQSHRGICEVCGRYHPNFPQIFLIPRYPTFIFFNAINPSQIESEFNFLFGPNGQFTDGFGNNFFDSNLTYDQILKLDAENTLRHVTSLQPYMHFFHQANLNTYAPGRSLVYDWAEAFLELYSSYYTIPLITLDWDKQAENIEKRTSFFNSDTQGIWDRSTGTVSVTSTNGGFVYLTNAGFSDVPTSNYGGDIIQKFGLAAGETRLSTTTGPTQNPNPLPVVTPVIPPVATPTNPTPVNPTPIDPTNPTPVDPTNPTPVDPTDPTPIDPNPVDPTPTPVDPNPVDPTPTPVNPTPVDPNNLLENGSFENNQASWSVCGIGQTRSVNDASIGNSAINLSGNGACLYQEVEIVAEQTYTLVCDTKRNINTAWSSLTLSFSNQDYSTTFPGEVQEIIGSNSSYGQTTTTATAPANAARATAVIYSEDAVTIDNCVLSAGTTTPVNPTPVDPTPNPTPPTDSNALTNGSFENSLNNWFSCGGSSNIVGNPVSGNNAVQLATNPACLYQEVSVSAGQSLQLSCSARVEQIDGFSSIGLIVNNATYGVELARAEVEIQGSTYQNFSTNLITPTGASSVAVTLYSKDQLNVDDCVLTIE